MLAFYVIVTLISLCFSLLAFHGSLFGVFLYCNSTNTLLFLLRLGASSAAVVFRTLVTQDQGTFEYEVHLFVVLYLSK